MPHGTEFTIVIVFALVLAIGAATRQLATRLGFPYTIAMLVIGLATGYGLTSFSDYQAIMEHFHEAYAGTTEWHPHASDYFVFALGNARNIKPDLIIFVFLPALIFESAYAIDLHTFKKTVGAAIVFAVPALLFATVLTGGMLYGLLDIADWDFAGEFSRHGEAMVTAGKMTEPVAGAALLACLLFGSLISATDPVAVVALLRELGVSKKMAHLIEGESLLNDGTAIVIFGVLFELVVGEHFNGVGSTLGHFAVVVAGGLAVGLTLAIVGSWWLGRIFNDPMVEIALTIVIGYTAMFVAEGLLHVSGVMAIVAAGLWLGGPGRTKVSPEVSHFLHHFWELLAYLANTLIFFLVGMVIGTQVDGATWADLGVILALYTGIMVIRYVGTFIFRPVANLVGDPISVTDVAVVSWGGLRGAVSMALVLIVANDPRVPTVVAQKMLLLSAGVVFMTIAFNGATMGRLLSWLGYDKPPLTDQLAALSARALVLDQVKSHIDEVRNSRDLRTVSWGDVEEDVVSRRASLDQEIMAMQGLMENLDEVERAKGYWVQMLNVEREAYWAAFGHGTLGDRAVKTLDQEINLQMDRIAHGAMDPPESRTPPLTGLRALLTRTLRGSKGLHGVYATLEFDNLAFQYDLSRAESSAASKVLAAARSIEGAEPAVATAIKTTYSNYLSGAKERLEEMRLHLPEVACAIETRLAHRIALNFEREGYEHLSHRGAMDHDLAVKLSAQVEEQMQRLTAGKTSSPLPELAELLGQIPLFQPLDEAALARLAEQATTVVVSAGEYLFRQGDRGDSLYVISRGAAHVLIDLPEGELLVDVFGGGDILGEMALLTGETRSASSKGATAVTLVRIGADVFDALMKSSDELSTSVWDAFAQRSFDNHIREQNAYSHLERTDRIGWIAGREHIDLEDGAMAEMPGEDTYVFVVTGSVRTVGGSRDHCAPCLVALGQNRTLSARSRSRVVVLPPFDEVAAAIHAA